MAVALLCGGSKKHLHQGGLSTDQLLPLSYEKISAVDRSDLSDYTYMVLEQVSSYGIIDGVKTEDPDLVKVLDMIEKPSIEEAPSRIAALGRYVITPEIFKILEQTKPGKGGEIQLTDALRVMAKNGNVYAYNFKGKRYDTGNKLGYLKAMVEFALRREDIGPGFREYLKTLEL